MSLSAIEYILNAIHNRIPPEILDLAFTPEISGESLDERIMTEVVRGIVLPDINLLSGKRTTILMTEDWRIPVREVLAPFTGQVGDFAFYRIPESARENKPIVSVESLRYGTAAGYGDPSVGYFRGDSINSIANMSRAMVESRTGNGANVSPMPVLVTGSIVRISPVVNLFSMYLVCNLAYDENLTNMSGGLIPIVQEMAVAATKLWIYTNMTVKLGAGEIVAGMTVDRVKEIIDGYSDQEAVYEEKKTSYYGVSNFFDPHTAVQMLQSMID